MMVGAAALPVSRVVRHVETGAGRTTPTREAGYRLVAELVDRVDPVVMLAGSERETARYGPPRHAPMPSWTRPPGAAA
jgi:hypothetical protein